MTSPDESARLHLWLRRVYFMAAGAVGCLLLAGVALHAFRVEWPTIGILAIVGTLAATLDIFIFEPRTPHKVKACLFWAFGFLLLSVMMTIVLLIPYAVLALISIAFGVWQDWETVGATGRYLPIPIGFVVGLLIWHLLDDY
jgi:hypothetical protein